VPLFPFTGASGRHPSTAPSEVVAGVVVEDRGVWNLAQALVDAEGRYRVVRDIGDNPSFVVWGFAVVPDLRLRADHEVEG